MRFLALLAILPSLAFGQVIQGGAPASVDSSGNESAQSAPAQATTEALPDTTPPSVPTGLAATAAGTAQINLSWSASTDTESGVAGYRDFRELLHSSLLLPCPGARGDAAGDAARGDP